jgi:tRNA modification GTPase
MFGLLLLTIGRRFTVLNDTIVAISTPLASAGIGIIRISGVDAIAITKEIFKPKKDIDYHSLMSHTLHYGHITDRQFNRTLDEVLVSFMIAPHTYTREDVVEINAHGGLIVMQSILSLVLRHGARIAEPGEFTKRAFLNGRIDLSQAEAVMDIIHAKTELALNASVKQLSGSIKLEVESIKEEVIQLIAHIEASIDYPEYDIEELEFEIVKKQCNELSKRVLKLVTSYDHGKIIREGIKTAIVGRPNVGKSSLLNALLKEQRAIVTEIPGTTRDTLEEYMNIHGIPLKLIDTAGIRNTDEPVEKIGVSRSKGLIQEADLILFVINSAEPLTTEDDIIMDLIKDKKVIILMNKSDLNMQVKKEHLKEHLCDCTIIETSATRFQGLDRLENEIKQQFMLGNISMDNEIVIHNARHKQSLDKAYQSLLQVIDSIDNGMPEDCWAIDMHNTYEQLSEVTGDHVTDDVISQIFSQFCLGK